MDVDQQDQGMNALRLPEMWTKVNLGLSTLEGSKVTGAVDGISSYDDAGGEKRGLNSVSSRKKIKPHVYKEPLADPSGEVMKETSRHFFKIYFYGTINEY